MLFYRDFILNVYMSRYIEFLAKVSVNRTKACTHLKKKKICKISSLKEKNCWITMCSIGEDDFGDEGGAHAMEKDIKSLKIAEEICKCSNDKISVIKVGFKDPMCVSCFLVHARHKFKATLGSTKIVRRGSSVLLNFTATPADVCLLDMIKFSMEADSHKRLGFDVKVIYIDENCNNANVAERFESVQEIRKILEQFKNFECFYSSLSDKNYVTTINEVTENTIRKLLEKEQKFTNLLDSLESLTSQQDFIETIRNDNLRYWAAHLNCQFVFLTDTTIDLAKRLIGNVALGRGSSVAYDVAFCDDRIESIKFLRPIKDLSKIEVDSYIKFKNLKAIDTANFGTKAGPFASIQNLTSQFIDGLQENYSSTVSTVFRGGSKISARTKSIPIDDKISSKLNFLPSVTDINQRCFLCKSFLDYQNSKTLFAIEFSRVVCEAADSEQLSKNTEMIEEKATSAVNSDGNELKKHLCHGCRNIFTGLSDDELLSEFL